MRMMMMKTIMRMKHKDNCYIFSCIAVNSHRLTKKTQGLDTKNYQ